MRLKEQQNKIANGSRYGPRDDNAQQNVTIINQRYDLHDSASKDEITLPASMGKAGPINQKSLMTPESNYRSSNI